MRGLWLAAPLLWGCGVDGDDGIGGPAETGPLTSCVTQSETRPPVSGTFEGRFAFSASDSTTFPLVVDLDTASGRFDVELSFSDAQRTFHGSGEGTIRPSGELEGEYTAVSGDAITIEGTVSGRMDATGGCGRWTNRGGQSGPWQVGEPAKPAGGSSSGDDERSGVSVQPMPAPGPRGVRGGGSPEP